MQNDLDATGSEALTRVNIDMTLLNSVFFF